MKTYLSLLVVLLSSLSLRAQGTVEFKNLVPYGQKVQICYWYMPGCAGWGGWGDKTLHDCPVEGYLVGLYWAPAGTTDIAAFEQLGPAASLCRPAYFNDGPRTIPAPFTGGAYASFLIKGWSSQYASYEATLASGNPCVSVSVSSVWVMKTGNPNASPPDTPPPLGSFGFPGLVLPAFVPEPNVLTLGLLGLAGWFLARRMRR